MIFTIIILLFTASISKAIMDVICFKYHISVFSKLKHNYWFNPDSSWRNKYKDNDPKKGAAFFGSTTFLSWTTDAWHFFQMIMLSSFQISIILCINKIFLSELCFWHVFVSDMIIFIAIKFFTGVVFEIFWKKILIK
jgi:hypothetical protein